MVAEPKTYRRVWEEDVDGLASESPQVNIPPEPPPAYSPAPLGSGILRSRYGGIAPSIDTVVERMQEYVRLLAVDVDRFALVLDALPATDRDRDRKRYSRVLSRIGYRTEYLIVPVPAALWRKEPGVPKRLHVLYVYSDGNETGIPDTIMTALFRPYSRRFGRPIQAALVLGSAYSTTGTDKELRESINLSHYQR